MASPQKENGYMMIANEIQEHLARMRIPGESYQILNVILRQTYGYRRKEDDISLDFFSEKTGLNKPHVCMAISKLLAMNLITEKGNEHRMPNTYQFNKNYDEWKSLPKKVTLPKKVMSVTEKGNEKGFTLYSSKDNTKDNMQRLGKNSTANPEWLDGEAWEEWEKFRREIRKTLTPMSRSKQLKLLEENKDDQKEIINNSITNGWTGLFPLKKGKEAKVPRVFK